MPGKTLITEAQVLRAVTAGDTTLVIPKDALITPLARDTARAHGIAFASEISTRTASPTDSRPKSTAPRALIIGSDHAGYGYKAELLPFIAGLDWRVVDAGTDSEQRCDYPDFAYLVARMVALGHARYGVMIDGAGVGSAMVCNKLPGVRAACAYNEFSAWNARAHNDANVLTLGSRTMGIEVCRRMVRLFLETEFEGGRHADRVQKIHDVDTRFRSA